MNIKPAIVLEQGRRPYMEDAYFLDLDFGKKIRLRSQLWRGKEWIFGGVYDGHNGKEAAEYAANNLHKKFLKILLGGAEIKDAFVKTYQEISDELRYQDAGTCAANFFVKDKKIYVANVGDARILTISRSGFHQLTIDHRLDNLDERERIQAMGGEIEYPYAARDGQGLMPTRTLGDEYFKPIGIIATPDINEYIVSDNDIYLIAATDGLFDVMTNEEVLEVSQKFDNPNDVAQTLKAQVLQNREGGDNLTIIVLGLQ
ncbi:protein phosphatase 2C domain-containing protein [Patescibacteria group bacterium AH-259-L07]|nr:protein phosphatase 2C domain-containing protein [Patescibacteria group bacterium AH-259-L07]